MKYLSCLVLLSMAAIVGCGGPEEVDEPACDPALDADFDGLDDCAELDYGTAPDKADTDDDGFSDSEEVDCVSDPLDVDEQCYKCGWAHGDPGDLDGVGPAEGDTLKNLRMTDQCGEKVNMHDFAGSYHILFMTTEWCSACLSEAKELRERTLDFEAESGLSFSYMIGVFQDYAGGPPNDESAADYADRVDAKRKVPVLSDVQQNLLVDTPYEGDTLPGKCVLSDQMVLMDCFTGHGDDADAFDMILEDAGAR